MKEVAQQNYVSQGTAMRTSFARHEKFNYSLHTSIFNLGGIYTYIIKIPDYTRAKK